MPAKAESVLLLNALATVGCRVKIHGQPTKPPRELMNDQPRGDTGRVNRTARCAAAALSFLLTEEGPFVVVPAGGIDRNQDPQNLTEHPAVGRSRQTLVAGSACISQTPASSATPPRRNPVGFEMLRVPAGNRFSEFETARAQCCDRNR